MLSAVYAIIMCLSVRLCVCLSHSGIVSKRLQQMQVGGLKSATFNEKHAITLKRYKTDAMYSFY